MMEFSYLAIALAWEIWQCWRRVLVDIGRIRSRGRGSNGCEYEDTNKPAEGHSRTLIYCFVRKLPSALANAAYSKRVLKDNNPVPQQRAAAVQQFLPPEACCKCRDFTG